MEGLQPYFLNKGSKGETYHNLSGLFSQCCSGALGGGGGGGGGGGEKCRFGGGDGGGIGIINVVAVWWRCSCYC